MPVEDLTYDALPETEGWVLRPSGQLRLPAGWEPQVGAGAANEDDFWSLIGSQDPEKAKLWAFLRGRIGTPYSGPLSAIGGGRFGDPGYDCSSFVSSAYRQLGVNLTPFTDAAAQQTQQVDPAQARPGDIIFYRYRDPSQPNVTYPHMGVYLGNGQMIDASYSGGVAVRPLLNQNYEIRRVPGVNPAAVVPAAAQAAQTAAATTDPLSRVGQIAQQSGLNEEGQRVAMAVATVEGGLRGAAGDPSRGGSYGAFQFLRDQGKLVDFARSQGMTQDQAAALLTRDPLAGVGWALNGYLGDAIRRGQAQGLHGADLATYVQRYGQRSDYAERAGNAYNQLATQGVPGPQTLRGAVDVPGRLGVEPPAPLDLAALVARHPWETYTPEENQGLTSMYERQYGERPQWSEENLPWQEAALGMQRAGEPITTDADVEAAKRQYQLQFREPYQETPENRQYLESALGMSRAGQLPATHYAPPETTEQDWGAAQNQYETQFGEPLDWGQYENNDETYGYIESALGMARAGELPSDSYTNWTQPGAEELPTNSDEEEGGVARYYPEEPDYGMGQDVGVGQGWWDDIPGIDWFGDRWNDLRNTPVLGGVLQAEQNAYQGLLSGTLPQIPSVSGSRYDEEQARQQNAEEYGHWNPIDWAGEKLRNAFTGQNPLYEIPVIGPTMREAGLIGSTALDVGNMFWKPFEYAGGAVAGAEQMVAPWSPRGQEITYDWGGLGGQKHAVVPETWGDVFDPAQAQARFEAQTPPVPQMAASVLSQEGFGLVGGALKGARMARESEQVAQGVTRFLDVPEALGVKEDIGRWLQSTIVGEMAVRGPLVGAVTGAVGGAFSGSENDDPATRTEKIAAGAVIGGLAGFGAWKAKEMFLQGADDYRILHYPEMYRTDDVMDARRLQVQGHPLTIDQQELLADAAEKEAQRADLLRGRFPNYENETPEVQDRIDRTIKWQMEADNLPSEVANRVPARAQSEYPFLQRELTRMAKHFGDERSALGAATDMISIGYRGVFNSTMPAYEDPEQLARGWAMNSARTELWLREAYDTMFDDLKIAKSDPNKANDLASLYMSSVAMRRALGTIEPVGPMTSADIARQTLLDATRGIRPYINGVPDGFMPTGPLAETPEQAITWFMAEAKRIEDQQPGRAQEWLNRLFQFDDHRSSVLMQAYEDAGGLRPGDAQRLAETNGIYGAINQISAGWDIARQRKVVEMLTDEQAIGHAFGTLQDVKYNFETLLQHDANLIAATEYQKTFQALRGAAENKIGSFEQFMVPMRVDEVDPITGATVSRFMTEEEARKAVPAGWGLIGGRHLGEPEMYRAPADLAESMLSMTPGTADKWVSMLGKLSIPFRMGATVASLPFIIGNMPRDVQNAIQNVGMPERILRNILPSAFDALTFGFDDFLAANRDHPLMMALPQRISDGIMAGLGQRVAQSGIEEALPALGEMTLTSQLRGGKTVAEMLGIRETPGVLPQIGRVIKTPYDLVTTISQVSELTTRTAVYRAALEAGQTEEEALALARSATVDFSRGGEFFKTFGSLMPLVNARIQGTIRSIEALQEDPQGYIHRLTIGAALPSAALYAYNRLVYGDLYDEVSQGVKDRNWVIGFGTIKDERDPQGKERLQYFTIPKGEMAAVVANPIEHMMDTVFHVKHGQVDLKDYQRTERSAGEMWLAQVANMLPVSQRGNTLTDLGAWMDSALAMNPILGTFAQLHANHDYFYDRPIIPDDQLMLPPEFRRGPHGQEAPWGARVLAAAANALHLPGLEVAPPQVAFTFQHLGGSAGGALLGATDLLPALFAGAGFPLPPIRATSMADIRVPEGVDPQTYWAMQEALQNQVDYRPWQVRLLPRLFGVSGGAQSITAKVDMLSSAEKHTWTETQAADAAMRLAREETQRKINAIYDDPNPRLSMQERSNKVDDLRKGLNATHEQIFQRDHPDALQTPAARDQFVASLPGVPIDVERFRPTSANLPSTLPVETLVARYRNPPGVDMMALNSIEQQQAMQRELAQMANEFQVPQSTLRDYIAASQLNNKIPSLPVPAVYLDRLVNQYQLPPGDYDPNDVQALYAAKRQLVANAAQAWGMSEGDLLDRVQTRMVSLQDTNPLALSRERARALYFDLKNMPTFADPQGRPVGLPNEWPSWQAELDLWKARHPNPAMWPEQIRALDAAAKTAASQQQAMLAGSPDYYDYQAWYGFGKSLSPQSWEKFITGGAPRYTDRPSTAESARRDGIIRLYQATPAGPQRNAMAQQVFQYRRLLTPAWRQQLENDDFGNPRDNLGELYG